MATDLYAIDNPHFHDAELYAFHDVYGHNKLRTPLFNNLTLKASSNKIWLTVHIFCDLSFSISGNSVPIAFPRKWHGSRFVLWLWRVFSSYQRLWRERFLWMHPCAKGESWRCCWGDSFFKQIITLHWYIFCFIQIVIIDEGVPYDVSHPFHLHGHNFFVVAMERHAANASHIGARGYPGNSIRKRVSFINMRNRN